MRGTIGNILNRIKQAIDVLLHGPKEPVTVILPARTRNARRSSRTFTKRARR